MAKNDFLSWDTTANNNTDVGGINIAENCPPSNINNSIRAVMAQLRAGVDGKAVLAVKTTNYTAVANDNNAFLRFTASATLSLTAVATLGANWHVTVIADGGDVTVDPNASETIDGAATLFIPNGYAVQIFSDGSAFYTSKSAGKTVKGQINGLVLTNNASDATNDIDVSAGEAASDGTTPYLMVLASAITKRLDASWSVGTNQGGLDTGTVGNNTYYIWLIQRSDTGVTDVLFSLSSTSPTMPANYDRKRPIGDLTRTGGVNGTPRSYSARVTRTVIVGGTSNVSGTYTPRPGCTEIRVQLQAAGGGGGYGRSTAGNAAVGGGGGNGQWAEKTIFAPAASYAYSLGANGKGGIAASSTAATDAATSTFGSPAILTCAGGSGGNSSSPTATLGGSAAGGAGGTGATGGDMQVDGVRGGYGIVFSATIAFSGAGADSKLGVGPNGADASSGPLSGAGYGSGGSGGVRTNGAQSDGGAGGLAILIIDEFG